MTNEGTSKVEISKEVLAPAEGPREELIATAVKFLQNPKVQQSPFSQRRAFLERKGLTKEEIDLAVERSGVPTENPTQVYPPQPGAIQQQPHGTVVPYQPAPPQSTLGRIRDVLHTVALIGGFSYVTYRFLKEVIYPWITGKPRSEERLDKIESMVIDLQKNIVETLSKIQVTLTTMQETMTANQEKVQALSHEVYSQRSSSAMSSIGETQFATEIKTELQTVKGLLLNRRQFPPTPSSSAVSLPSWQLQQTSNKETPSGKQNLVKPSGDATQTEAELNKNGSERLEQESNTEIEIKCSETPLNETEDIKESGDTVVLNGPIKSETESSENGQIKFRAESFGDSNEPIKLEDTNTDEEID